MLDNLATYIVQYSCARWIWYTTMGSEINLRKSARGLFFYQVVKKIMNNLRSTVQIGSCLASMGLFILNNKIRMAKLVIPKNTLIVINIMKMDRNSEIWGGKCCKTTTRFSYMQFSAGSENCIGKNYIGSFVYLLLVSRLQQSRDCLWSTGLFLICMLMKIRPYVSKPQ